MAEEYRGPVGCVLRIPSPSTYNANEKRFNNPSYGSFYDGFVIQSLHDNTGNKAEPRSDPDRRLPMLITHHNSSLQHSVCENNPRYDLRCVGERLVSQILHSTMTGF